MSSALGRLRKQLDDPLFVNTRSGMLPTPRALELAPSLTDALVSGPEAEYHVAINREANRGAAASNAANITHAWTP